MPMLRSSLFLLLLQVVQGFKWMEKIKVPTLVNLRRNHIGSKFGDKKLVVITGTSSGLGKATTKALLKTNKYHVIGAVRDLDKMKNVADAEGFDLENFTPMHLDLTRFDSVKHFAQELDKLRGDRPIDRLACNAAIYQATRNSPQWTVDGHEQQLQTNFLSHFLLTSKLMPMMQGSDDPRICMIGSVTGNGNAIGGGKVEPIGDLKELKGLELNCKNPIAMMDGSNFNGAKSYKDTKLALMMTSNMLHERFHRSSDISFSSIYPGCLADSPIFKEKREWFEKHFPAYMEHLTSGFIGEQEAGQRLFQVLHDPRCRKSGTHWGWNGAAQEGNSIVENEHSEKTIDKDLGLKLWKHSCEVTGAEWPPAYQPKSPCPTLLVVGAAGSILGVLEEQARMKASREGAGAKILADKTLPKEERRKQLGEMLQKLDNTPTDPEEIEWDLFRTSGKSPAVIDAEAKRREEKKQAAQEAEMRKTWVGKFRLVVRYLVRYIMLSLMRFISSVVALITNKGSIPTLEEKTTPKEVTEEDLRAALANENMKLAEAVAAEAALSGKPPTIEAAKPFSADDAVVPEVDDPALEAEEKGPPKMIPGGELLGDIPVVFQPQNVMTMARVGQPLSEVASGADVFIRYKCRKGECKTCVVKIDGKWVSACQTKIPPVMPGQHFEVRVQKVSDAHKYKQTATFFSPKSLVDGGINNALGMVGFAKDGIAADTDFQDRMERERMIDEITAKKAKEKQEKEKQEVR